MPEPKFKSIDQLISESFDPDHVLTTDELRETVGPALEFTAAVLLDEVARGDGCCDECDFRNARLRDIADDLEAHVFVGAGETTEETHG